MTADRYHRRVRKVEGLHRQCLECGGHLGGSSTCPLCGTDASVPHAEAGNLTEARCVCGSPAVSRCADCETAICEEHRDRFFTGSRGEPPVDPEELAVWRWATSLERDSLSAAEGKPAAGRPRCSCCRARFALAALTAVRALPVEDGTMCRQVAAVRTGWAIDGLYSPPPAGVGRAAAAWLSSHRVRPAPAVTAWVCRGTTAFRPYSILTVTPAWVLADPDTDYWWVVSEGGAVALSPRQGTLTGRPMVGAVRHRAGDATTYGLSWDASIPRATRRLATALSNLSSVPVDPGPGDLPEAPPRLRL